MVNNIDSKMIQEKIEAIEAIPQAIAPSNGKHIFFSILQKNKSLLSSEDYMFLLYSYCYCEKALNERRRNNVEMAKWYLNKVDLDILNVHEQCLKDMQIIYDPVLSYNLYLDKDFAGALKHLSMSIKQIDKCLENADISAEFIKAKLEQVLNVFRIFIAEKDIRNATNCAKDLLGYLLYQNRNGLFKDQADMSESIKKMEQEWVGLIEYFFNIIIIKYLGLAQDGIIKEDDLLSDLFIHLFSESTHLNAAPVYKGISLMSDYYTSGFDDFADAFMGLDVTELSAMPLTVKYLIVSKLVQLLDKNDKINRQQLLQSFIQKNDLNGSLAKIQFREMFIGEA